MKDFVSISTLATMLENGLNKIVGADNYTFKVIAGMGDYITGEKPDKRQDNKSVINCVLVPLPSAITPVSGLNNYYLQMSLSIVAPKGYVDRVSEVVNSYIKSQVGTLISVDGYTGVINFDMLSVGALIQMPIVGTGSIIATNIYYQFIKGGVIANECVFIIDEQDTLITEWSVGKSRVPQTDNIENSEVMRSVIAGQGLQLTVSMPYVRNSVCEKLFNELWNGKLNTAHTIAFYDGVVASAASPIRKKMTMLTGTISGITGNVPLFQFAFTEAYDE